jgi:hypothetical protein
MNEAKKLKKIIELTPYEFQYLFRERNLTLTLDEIPTIKNINSCILKEYEKDKSKFEMGGWHDGDKHCLAGWAIHLGGEEGYELQSKVGPGMAGSLIFAKNSGHVPNFYSNNRNAIKNLRRRAARERRHG